MTQQAALAPVGLSARVDARTPYKYTASAVSADES